MSTSALQTRTAVRQCRASRRIRADRCSNDGGLGRLGRPSRFELRLGPATSSHQVLDSILSLVAVHAGLVERTVEDPATRRQYQSSAVSGDRQSARGDQAVRTSTNS